MGEVLAIGMLSGGLDSTLATRLLLDQGIHVKGIHFNTGFCFIDHRRKLARTSENITKLINPVTHLTALFDISIEIIDIRQEYLEVLRHPKYGYGKNMNPCIDCRVMMMGKARDFMEESGADFIFTGEVLGQRPMTQHRRTLHLIEKQSGLQGKLLRPLSAKLLPETEPERQGLVDRNRLYNFSGRSRKPQLNLAQEYGITDFPQPAGGCCFLTDPIYSRKLKDLFKYKNPDDCTLRDFLLLKVGRHLRVSPDLKVIVGRDESENQYLDSVAGEMTRLETIDVMGPVVFAEGDLTEENLRLAAEITARYSDGKNQPSVDVNIRSVGGEQIITVKPKSPETVAHWVIS
jgi:tRNA-specific 2-thiouridylase